MHQRRALALISVSVIAAAVLLSQIDRTEQVRAVELGPSAGIQVPSLRDTLTNGLEARLPSEFQFIDTVVTMVENDQLPLELVQSTFQWARKKVRSRKYPFPYFERALRIRAARLGIVIP